MALYFISGKGGVGKTHLSYSFAKHLSQKGRRALLVEFSEFPQYSEYFSKLVSFEPVELAENLYCASWTGKDCLREYAGKILRSQKASDFFLKMPIMEKLINAAPGLKEIAVLGKITSDYREFDLKTGFEDIVFDAPSSGHFVSLLEVPASLGSVVGIGPMKKQCTDIENCLVQSKQVFFAVINDGSIFSQNESDQTVSKLQKCLGQKPINLIQNFKPPFDYVAEPTWLKSALISSEAWKDFQWKN
jgi:anion-transporting  ArsA/GET3 family ATPase